MHDVRAQLSRREKIQAATVALEDAAPGQFRTIEPFPEEPGYHRFRYVADDGTAVGGNYIVDGDLIENFNIGDVNNPVELGRAQLRKLFDQIQATHPDVRYVHAYRKSGARTHAGTGETDMWLELTDKGAKFRGTEDPRLADLDRDLRDVFTITDDKGRIVHGVHARTEGEAIAATKKKGWSYERHENAVELISREDLMAQSTRVGVNASGDEIFDNPRGRFTLRSPDDRPNFGGDGIDVTENEPAVLEDILNFVEARDPAAAERIRQELALRIKSPMRPGAVDPDGTGGLGLFDAADQPTFRLTEDGEEVSAADLLAELDDDDAAIKAIKDCL